jgi:hypothetical protein
MNTNRFTRSRWAALGVAFSLAAGLVGSIGIAAASDPNPAPVLTTITPCRLLDTRASSPVGTRTTPVAGTFTTNVWGTNGQCTIPSTALGVIANVTVTNGTIGSFLTVWPSDQPQPLASSLNWVTGQPPTPNQVTSDLSATGQLSFFNNAGTVDIIVDLVGYFTPHNHDGDYVAPLYAVVKANGDLVRGSHVVATGNLGTGAYRVQFDRDVSKCAYSLLVESLNAGLGVVAPPAALPDPNSVVVGTADLASGITNRPFHLIVIC